MWFGSMLCGLQTAALLLSALVDAQPPLLGEEEMELAAQDKTSMATKMVTVRFFSPNYGFEHYWPGGEWFMLKSLPTKARPTRKGEIAVTTTVTTTTMPPTVCGEDCPEAYREIKQVCTRQAKSNGGQMDHFLTMDSYCAFLQVTDPNCIPHYYDGVVFVHVGPCVSALPAVNFKFPPELGYADAHDRPVKERISKFLDKFYKDTEWTRFYPGRPYPIPPFHNVDRK